MVVRVKNRSSSTALSIKPAGWSWPHYSLSPMKKAKANHLPKKKKNPARISPVSLQESRLTWTQSVNLKLPKVVRKSFHHFQILDSEFSQMLPILTKRLAKLSSNKTEMSICSYVLKYTVSFFSHSLQLYTYSNFKNFPKEIYDENC